MTRALLLATLAFLAATSPAAAASGWAGQPVPAPAVANGDLEAVSCTSASACTAVGTYVNSAAAQLTLAERWNGSVWSVQPTPNLASDQLTAVSCGGPSSCMAVASSEPVELWDGSSWSLQSVAKPAGVTSMNLFGVSCTSGTSCTVVGSYATSTAGGMLIERWDGTSWSAHLIPDPAHASRELNGVSCTSATACTAVGVSGHNSGSSTALVERWNGTEWSLQPTPNPVGRNLWGVSCTSNAACTAVGSYSTDQGPDAGGVAVAERWNGSSWSIQRIPNLPESVTLQSVSCTSASACTAVGGPDVNGPLVERWNGSDWSIQPTAAGHRGRDSALTGVSCASSTVCTAVGNYGPDVGFSASGLVRVLEEGWNGTGWSVQTTRSRRGATNTVLGSVSCPSSTTCLAIGGYLRSDNTVAIAGLWDGTSWTIQQVPRPAGARSIQLGGVSCNPYTYCNAVGDGVSCTSATSCIAVGSYEPAAGHARSLAERWDGASWSIEDLPSPPGATRSVLNSVSCISRSFCVAVGGYASHARGQRPFEERWNGSSWSLHLIPSRTGARDSFLNSVSCTSASFCTVVGTYDTPKNGRQWTLAERWNGSKWSFQATPKPSPNPWDEVLAGVSCTSRTACTAVGSYWFWADGWTGGGYVVSDTLAERWNGTRWSIQATPSPHSSSILGGVSCTSRTVCTAVGGPYLSEGQPFAESWNGSKWSLQPMPNLKAGGGLAGVSCTSAGDCTAVGEYGIYQAYGTFTGPLAERHS